MEVQHEKSPTCGTICLKSLLLIFNVLFWLAGGAVLVVGVWTLVAKSDYISLLNSSFYTTSTYLLIAAGCVVIVTGIIGCCATLNERRSLLIVYLVLLLCIFLLEIIAGVLAFIYYQKFKCCGSNSSADWADSLWIKSDTNHRLVPDSCCKSPSHLCGLRDHPSNIYKVEGGCIMKLEEFILDQLYIIGVVGGGIAFLQLLGMMFTCCLYRNLKDEPY
ncbi:CD151 antigen isoform X3 [Synchiropus splendidus]|uniref:CD151 antigen isoform X3 n=1 Tax=Synchiropus splendidus TaxID=270530 RepID=UPI00237EBA47|nr:CD151 antigen isoform X3 [Synchiropus splendidus]